MDILTYTLDNQTTLQKLCKPLLKQYKKALVTSPLFSDEIVSQCETECKKVFTDFITKNLAINTEDVIVVLENFDVMAFLE